jgi:hypothetical protein
MKNLSTSRATTSLSYQTRPLGFQAKPLGYQENPQEYLLEIEDDSSVSALSQGVYHQVEDWVALELTAEQMLSNEVGTLSSYVAGDAKQMWAAIKDTLLPYELAAGQFLLRAADPTQVEWLQGHWWGGQEGLQH